jgi:poly-gamma-glutamate capsule biosynthesis protein CapA/YwtB (metallophosphatase superfamily)
MKLILLLSVSAFANSITAVGDVMLGSSYLSSLDSCPQNPLSILQSIPKSDITFCNMEGTLLNSGLPTKHCSNCFSFRMPESLISQYTIFNLISQTNNHSRDFGEIGTQTTSSLLKQNNIHFANYSQPLDTFTINNIRYTFCAFNTAWHTIRDADSILSFVDKSTILIISIHGGAEGNAHSHVTKRNEVFYGENRGNVYSFAHHCIDKGASIILGHGPHVTRAIELYKNKFIAYSLGNFATCGFKLEGNTSIAPIIQINFDNSGNFISGKIYPIIQRKFMPPILDTNNTAIKQIINLTHQDFPNTNLTINDDGDISK